MKKLLNRIVMIITIMAAVLASPLAALESQASEAHPPRIVDEADLISTEEENVLAGALDEVSEAYQFDVVVVTVNSLNGEDIQYYAADYYDYNGYGMGENYDGAMFIMSMEEREWFILTTGYGIDLLTDSELDNIGEEMVPFLSGGDYIGAFLTYIEEVESELEEGVTEPKPSILLSIVAGLALGFVPALIIRGKLKSVKMQTNAGRYENRSGRKVTTRQDVFIYHTVSRVPRESDDGGGSSTFKGSSGRSHGGRGGSF